MENESRNPRKMGEFLKRREMHTVQRDRNKAPIEKKTNTNWKQKVQITP